MIASKIERLVDDLIYDFSIEKLKEILEFKNNNFTFYGNNRKRYYEDDFFNEVYFVGEVRLSDQSEFVVFAVKIAKELSERSSKKKQFELAKRILKDNLFDAGFFVFYDDSKNFRFSFVNSIYIGTKRDFSHYKRYTYFVERGKPCRTFKRALVELKLDSIESIKSAFAVWTLIREFYTEIQN